MPNKIQTADAKPRKLGRGLSALIGSPVPVAPPPGPGIQAPTEPRPTLDADLRQGLISISVDDIEPSRFQPRRVFDQVSLERLADSIKSTGMMQPVILRPGSGGVKRYELVAGERRWRAAVIANLPSVPSLIRELSDEQAAEWAII